MRLDLSERLSCMADKMYCETLVINQDYVDRSLLLYQSLDTFDIEAPDSLKDYGITYVSYTYKGKKGAVTEYDCKVYLDPMILANDYDTYMNSLLDALSSYLNDHTVVLSKDLGTYSMRVVTLPDRDKGLADDAGEVSAWLYYELFNYMYYFDVEKHPFMKEIYEHNKVLSLRHVQFMYLYEHGFKFETVKTHVFYVKNCNGLDVIEILESGVDFPLVFYVTEHRTDVLDKMWKSIEALIGKTDNFIFNVNIPFLYRRTYEEIDLKYKSVYESGIVYGNISGKNFTDALEKFVERKLGR